MEITLKDILEIIKKHLLVILIVSLVFSVIAFCVTSFLVPKEYTTKVKLYVVVTDTSNSSAINTLNYAKNLVPTYIEMLETTKFYTNVSEKLNNAYTSAEISKKVSFKAIEDTEVFEAVIVHSEPAEAKRIADAIAEVAPKQLSALNGSAKLSVVDDATLPKEPSSPDVPKIVLFTFLGAFCLSVLVIFAITFLDTKVKHTSEMTELMGIPILSVIPLIDEKSRNRKIHL